MPTGRAPRRASQAETYAVPQPSSMVSSPVRSSGSTFSSVSGTDQMPHDGWACQASRPISTYPAAHASHAVRLIRTWSGSSSMSASVSLACGESRVNVVHARPKLGGMDIRVEERALAPVGEKAVQLAHAGGLEIRRLLEQFRDLQEIGAHEGNPVVEKHVEPPAGPTARR